MKLYLIFIICFVRTLNVPNVASIGLNDLKAAIDSNLDQFHGNQ